MPAIMATKVSANATTEVTSKIENSFDRYEP